MYEIDSDPMREVLVMFPATLLLAELNSQVGFAINGTAPFEQIGWSVNVVGDLNADGIDDLAIGAPHASVGGLSKAGIVYVLFGRRGSWPSSFNLFTLNPSTGFVLSGLAPGDGLGWSVNRAGDVNGDRVDDLVIGAPFVDQDTGQGKAVDTGQSYVIFGQRNRFRLANTRLSALDGRNGFVINGQAAGDQLGYAVSTAGDLNADGVGDIILGAPLKQSPRGPRSGQSYIIFGQRSGFSAVFDWSSLNKPRIGTIISGASAGEQSGFAVDNAGDLNGDGVTDIVIGAPFATTRGANSGRSYVIFGNRVGFNPALDLAQLNGRSGFALNGHVPQGRSGFAVSGAGDVNGDQVADLMIGAPFAQPSGLYSGQSYVVLGRRGGFTGSFDLGSLNGRNGWMLNGQMGRSGFAVTGLGDINGDRKGDLLIGAPYDSVASNLGTGRGYVFFGRTANTTEPMVALPLLDGITGFKLNGHLPEEAVGYAVTGRGDLNGDRLMDMVISAPLATVNGLTKAGQVYVIFGKPPEPPKVVKPTTTPSQKATAPKGGGQAGIPLLPTPPIPKATP